MRFMFGIGTGFTANGSAIDPGVAKALVDRLIVEAVSRFGGCFVQHGTGAWKDHDGNVVVEPGLTVTCEVDAKVYPSVARLEAKEFAEFARRTFQQQAILVTEFGTFTHLHEDAASELERDIAEGRIGLD